MSGRYNGHFHSFFMGCPIVGRLADEGRGRTITLYAIAGEPEVVGMYDGVDTWVGSSSICGKKVIEELAAVHMGEAREIEQGQTRARLHDLPGAMGRPYVEPFGASRPRRVAHRPGESKPRRVASSLVKERRHANP